MLNTLDNNSAREKSGEKAPKSLIKSVHQMPGGQFDLARRVSISRFDLNKASKTLRKKSSNKNTKSSFLLKTQEHSSLKNLSSHERSTSNRKMSHLRSQLIQNGNNKSKILKSFHSRTGSLQGPNGFASRLAVIKGSQKAYLLEPYIQKQKFKKKRGAKLPLK